MFVWIGQDPGCRSVLALLLNEWFYSAPHRILLEKHIEPVLHLTHMFDAQELLAHGLK